MEFGSLAFKTEPIGDFQGDLDVATSFFNNMKAKAQLLSDAPSKHISSVASRDAKLNQLYGEVINNPSHLAHLELQEELGHRMKADHIFEMFAESQYNLSNEDFPLPTNFACLKTMVNHTEEHCGRFSDYSLKYVKYLVRECENLVSSGAIDGLMHRIKKVCQ